MLKRHNCLVTTFLALWTLCAVTACRSSTSRCVAFAVTSTTIKTMIFRQAMEMLLVIQPLSGMTGKYVTLQLSVVTFLFVYNAQYIFQLIETCPITNQGPHPCNKHPHREHWATEKCNIILSDVFAACHAHVDPTPFYDNCLYDTCGCDYGGDCECFCTAVAAYAQVPWNNCVHSLR